MASREKAQTLIRRGVRIPDPGTVSIGEEVDPERIAARGVVIHPGCRVSGKDTLILENSVIGAEGPAVVSDCQLGPGVELKGGFFQRSTFLGKASLGPGAHVREGCLLEEESGGAHCVGLKQTILFPFVTLGSLINFCDCLMAGGTGRKNHSEVGSSYIHFNFSPNADKATPSLLGDVPRGVTLRQPPIFLGGQGGLVGPVRLGYGTVIAAGTIWRADFPAGGKLLFGRSTKAGAAAFDPTVYRGIGRKIANNFTYIANLFAFRRWHLHARALFPSGPLEEALHRGALEKLDLNLRERVTRLGELAGRMPSSLGTGKPAGEEAQRQRELHANWPRIEEEIARAGEGGGDEALRDLFLEKLSRERQNAGRDYLAAVKALDEEAAGTASAWLQGIVDGLTKKLLALIPSF